MGTRPLIDIDDEAEFIAAVERGMADARAGRTISHDDFMALLDAIIDAPPTPPAARRYAIRYGVAYCLACNLAVAYCACETPRDAAPGGMTMADAATQRIVARRLQR